MKIKRCTIPSLHRLFPTEPRTDVTITTDNKHPMQRNAKARITSRGIKVNAKNIGCFVGLKWLELHEPDIFKEIVTKRLLGELKQ